MAKPIFELKKFKPPTLNLGNTKVSGQAGKNIKIIVFVIAFIAWGSLVGFSKAIIFAKGTTSKDTGAFLECTYFNGFVFKTLDVREMNWVPNDAKSCPSLIEADQLGAWTP